MHLTISLKKESNVATLYSAPGYAKSYALCAESNLIIEEYTRTVALQDNINGKGPERNKIVKVGGSRGNMAQKYIKTQITRRVCIFM